ncbi:MAG: hypothetical protein IT381_33115 [Deltaproteobacteria bacterium]|nr:hypothetical protein [Deltaproteobacteria bacterium]
MAMPAVQTGAAGTLSFAPGAAFALEYYPLNYLSAVLRLSYQFPIADSRIGNATFSNRDGIYWLRQGIGFATLGLRIATPQYWLPVTFSLSAQGGLAVLVHTERELRNDADIVYSNVKLEPQVQFAPCIVAGVGISFRVTDQVRLGIEPTLHVVFAPQAFIGMGLAASLAFFFFT